MVSGVLEQQNTRLCEKEALQTSEVRHVSNWEAKLQAYFCQGFEKL